jgi:RNA polymerase-associated protein
MALYSGAECVFSHGCRIVVYEKEVECQIIYLGEDDESVGLAELNPYNETPTLLDRDLVLYSAQIINEYLDERLPHPPLMPVDPVNRGRARLMIMRFCREWLVPLHEDRLDEPGVRQAIRDGLIALSPVLAEQPYMLGGEYSLVDSFLSPLLWRLGMLKINLPRQARPVTEYAERLFERPAFLASLSEVEREMR